MTHNTVLGRNSATMARALSAFAYAHLTAAELPLLRDSLLRVAAPAGATGRVLLAAEGWNAQLFVPEPHLMEVSEALASMPGAETALLNVDAVALDEPPSKAFPSLQVRVRPRIVSAPEEAEAAVEAANHRMGQSVVGGSLPALPMVARGGRREALERRLPYELDAADWHTRLAGGEDAVVLDVRNWYESAIGRFEGATALNTDYYRDSTAALEQALAGVPRRTPVLMSCTGGIRCVKVSHYVQEALGFDDVASLRGGVVAYARYVANTPDSVDSRFKGANFVFDNRLTVPVTSEAFGACERCGAAAGRVNNCANRRCGLLMILCEACAAPLGGMCSRDCAKEVAGEGASQMVDKGRSHEMAYVRHRLRGGDVRSVDFGPRHHERHAASMAAVARSREAVPPPIERSFHSDASSSDASSQSPRDTYWLPVAGAVGADVHQYAAGVSTPPPGAAVDIESRTLEEHGTRVGNLSGPLVGTLLTMLMRSRIHAANKIDAVRALDLGTFTGYSAVCLASALPRGSSQTHRVISVESDAAAVDGARAAVAAAGYDGIIDVCHGTCDEVLHSLSGRTDSAEAFDVIFMDADKRSYRRYLDTILESELLKLGGWLVVDNTLWKGKVVARNGDDLCKGTGAEARWMRVASDVASFNAHVASDPRVSQVLLPVCDGVTLIQRVV